MSPLVIALIAFGAPTLLVVAFIPLMAKVSRRVATEQEAAWAAYIAHTGMERIGNTTTGVRDGLRVSVVEEVTREHGEFPTTRFRIHLDCAPPSDELLWTAMPPAMEALVPGMWQLEGPILSSVMWRHRSDIASELEVGLGLARAIRHVTLDPAAALVLRVRDHGESQPRIRALRLLARLATSDARAAACLETALHSALSQPDRALHLAAAELAGNDAEVEQLATDGYPDALAALVRKKAPREALYRVVDTWLAAHRDRDADTAMVLIAALAELFAPGANPAAALAGPQREAYERHLVEVVVLGHANDEAMGAALRLLRDVGTIAAVPRLRAFADARKDLLAELARDTVIAIQARVVDAETGGLALAEDAGGELALASKAMETRTADVDEPSGHA